MADGIAIVGVAASTSIGRNARSSMAAARAGINLFGRHPYVHDRVGEPVCVARADWLDVTMNGAERCTALLLPTLQEIIDAVRTDGLEEPSIALALALPGPRPGSASAFRPDGLRAAGRSAGARYTGLALFESGHAGGLLALEAGVGRLHRGGVDLCVVAGVDSYIDPSTLEWLEGQDRLHGAGAFNNAWGFIPGEAAGAIALMRRADADAAQVPVLATVRGTGSANEACHRASGRVCIGEGLTAALRGALASLPPEARVADVYCDLNGEPFRADEYGFACTRVGRSFESASAFVAPADCWGDVGAASAPLLIARACAAAPGVRRPERYALVWASSDGGERAAALLAMEAGN